jgi:MinD superfamily P-loop ATPase
MRYAESITINGDMLFCKPIKRKATAKELFKIDDFMKEKCVKWSDCVRVCMDSAHVMAGYRKRL